ncbi:DNA ligase 1-like [Clytia hemisphaerica]
MPSYLIVDWAGENYSDVLSAAKVAAQDGIDVGKTIQVQNGQEIWTGEIASIHASQSKAEKAYRERFPKASSTPAADGKRQRKKKSFGDDFEDDAAAEKINEEQSEASEKKMAQSEKEPSEKEPSEKEKTKTGKMKVKADKEKAKANKEKEKAEKEKARAEKEKEKEAKQKEREEREKKKQEEEETLKNKENLYMEQIDAIENEKSVDFETSSSPFNCIIEENFSSGSDGLPNNFLANVQKLAGHSPIINSPIINSPFNKSPPSAVLSPVLSPKKPKHPNKGGKAPRAEFTEKKLTATPSKTQRPNKGGKFPRSLPSLSPRPRLSPRQPFKPAGANKQQPYRYAIKKSCNGCAEKSKIINDQTATIKP